MHQYSLREIAVGYLRYENVVRRFGKIGETDC